MCAFCRLLAKVPEHTWGVDVKKALNWDYSNLTNSYFHENLENGNPGYELAAKSWRRQAHYVQWALEALGPQHPVVREYEGDVDQRLRLSEMSESDLKVHATKVKALQGSKAFRYVALQLFWIMFWIYIFH